MRIIGDMPPYYEVAHALWGKECDFDSDGDSEPYDSICWRELTVILRPELRERVDIDPLESDRDTIHIRANSVELLNATCRFLYESGAAEPIIL